MSQVLKNIPLDDMIDDRCMRKLIDRSKPYIELNENFQT